MGTETLALEVIPQEQAGVGSVETAWGGLGTSLLGLMEQRLLGKLESRGHGRREQYAKGWEVESLVRGKLVEELDLQERQGANVWEGIEEGVGQHRILPTPQRIHWPTSYQKAVLPSALTPLPLTHMPDLGLPVIPEGWSQQLLEAYHCKCFTCPSRLALWRGYTPMEQHKSPWKNACSLENIEQAQAGSEKSANILSSPSKSGCPGEMSRVISGPASCSSP